MAKIPDTSAIYRVEGNERVPDSSVLRSFTLLTLLCVTGSVLSDQGIGYGTYSYPADAYAEEAAYGYPYAPYGNGAAGIGNGDEGYPHAGVPDRIYDSYRDDPYAPSGSASRRYGQIQGGVYQSNHAASAPMPYGGSGARGFDVPRDLGSGYSDRRISGVESPAVEARGYRFRGDGPAGDGTWSTSTFSDGYRFRPLTDQERERRGGVSGWRPRRQERSGGRPERPGPLPVDEAYGYESDNWFRRYYRGRP